MPVTELDVDERLARTASRKLHRYGAALNDCLNSVLLTEAYSVEELKGNLVEAVEAWLGGEADLRSATASVRTAVV